MSATLHVEFEPPASRSILLRIRTADSGLDIWASCVQYDSVADLAGAIAFILKGGSEATVSWNAEPTEYDICFRREGDRLRLTVIQHPDSRRTRSGGTTVLEVVGNPLEICLPFWRALRRLESAMPPAEFEAEWSRRFPREKVSEITTLIKPPNGEDRPAFLNYADPNVGRLVTIARFRDEASAHMAASCLEAEGIESTVRDVVRSVGVKRPASLSVLADDVEVATAILKETPARASLVV
jgi:hypothetical protein